MPPAPLASVPVWLLLASAIGAALAGAGLIFVFRKQLSLRLTRERAFKSWFDNVDYIIGIGATAIATTWKVLDLSMWTNPVDEFLWAVVIFSFLVGFVLYSKLLKHRVDAQEKILISSLEAERQRLTSDRNWLISMVEMLDDLLKEKIQRLQGLLRNGTSSPKDYFSAQEHHAQILLVIQTIHEFFAERLASGKKLRLGVYVRSDEDRDALALAYSWDGQREDCFSQQSKNYLKIVRHNGILSELAKCYHSRDGVIIVSDCEQSAKDNEFEFLRADQKAYMCSILVFRFEVPKTNGDKQFWLLYLDSDQKGYFDASKKSDYETFLRSMGRRVALELANLDLGEKFYPPHQT